MKYRILSALLLAAALGACSEFSLDSATGQSEDICYQSDPCSNPDYPGVSWSHVGNENGQAIGPRVTAPASHFAQSGECYREDTAAMPEDGNLLPCTDPATGWKYAAFEWGHRFFIPEAEELGLPSSNLYQARQTR